MELIDIEEESIDAEILERLRTLPDDSIVVLDMAVLTESQLGAGIYQYVVVVEADPVGRIDRIIRRGLTEADARARMASLATDTQRRTIADLIVPNTGALDELERAVDIAWIAIRRAATPAAPAPD